MTGLESLWGKFRVVAAVLGLVMVELTVLTVVAAMMLDEWPRLA